MDYENINLDSNDFNQLREIFSHENVGNDELYLFVCMINSNNYNFDNRAKCIFSLTDSLKFFETNSSEYYLVVKLINYMLINKI